MRPVVTLQARIVQIARRRAGRDRRLQRDLDRQAPDAPRDRVGRLRGRLPARRERERRAAGAEAIVAGQRCPLAGRVSMDLIAVDVTDVPQPRQARRPRHAARRRHRRRRLAARAGTIGYEVLTSLGRRYRRIYRSDRLSTCMFLYCSHRIAMVIGTFTPHSAPHGQERRPPSSARTAARSTAAGRASASPAASGTRSSRKAPRPTARSRAARRARAACSRSSRSTGETHDAPRLPSGMPELDRVTGGGFVRGSVLLMAAIPASANRPC